MKDDTFTLIHIVPSGEWGTPERYAFDLCRFFSAESWKTKVLTRDVKPVDSRFEEGGIEVRHAPLRQYPDYYSAKCLARLFAEMPRGKGIVHVHRYNDALTCILARLMARRPDIRLVATRHKAERGKDSVLRRIIYKGIDSHLFVSDFAKQTFYEGWSPGRSPLREEKTDVVHPSLYHTPSTFPGQPEKGPIAAAYRGKLQPGKGLETLIDAFALLEKSKVRLRIMGNGQPDYVDALRRRAQLAGISDRIDWSRDTDFSAAHLPDIHFGVIPSDNPEAFSLTSLEFMAYGKPRISTYLGGECEIMLPGEDTLTVPPGEPEPLADAIRRLASDASLRKNMGRKAFDLFGRKFSWQNYLNHIIPHYTPPT